MPVSEAERIHAEIRKLSPPDRLRLAAELLEHRKAELAHTIASGVVVELGAALTLAKAKGKADG